MRESEYEKFSNADPNIISKTKAVRFHVRKARIIERHFDMPLDGIVADDNTTYETLLRIKAR